jgi:DNA-binding MarR family transcriptional regulator
MGSKSKATGTLRRMAWAIEAARMLDDAMPLQTLAVFLDAAIHEGEPENSVSEIGKRVGLQSSSASRNVAALSKWHWLKKPGLELLDTVPDPMEMRRKIVALTPKGRRLAEQIIGALEGGSHANN